MCSASAHRTSQTGGAAAAGSTSPCAPPLHPRPKVVQQKLASSSSHSAKFSVSHVNSSTPGRVEAATVVDGFSGSGQTFAALSRQSTYSSIFLNGWKETLRGSSHALQPLGGSQWSSISSQDELTRSTFSTLLRHWSMNMSSPHKQSPLHMLRKWVTQCSRPWLHVHTALRLKTSSGPCRPCLQLLKYTPLVVSSWAERSERSRQAKNTASGSTFAVHWKLPKMPSSTTCCQTLMKIGVLSAVWNSPPYLQCKVVFTTVVRMVGVSHIALLLYTE
mmetsp:Transcript_13780/g.40972  ORF Transcript_13780/g.40972 Transcript_13780/m.40972 type:complete len:275 (+) Transcript_13780:688-1512(+)